MHDKGFATQTVEGRAFRYNPAVSQAELLATAAPVSNILNVMLDAPKAAVAAAKPGKKK